MNELHYIILYCIQKINGERTVASIYHLLNGKRSGQTIQDGHLFGILFLFSIFKGLQERVFYQYIDDLEKKKWLIRKNENFCILTDEGKEEVEQYYHRYPFSKHLNGYEFGDEGRTFWKHLTLLIQSLSQLQYEENKFIPIEESGSVQQRIKSFLFYDAGCSVKELAQCIGNELTFILKQCSNYEGNIFVGRLTGYKRAGLTFEQLGQQYQKDMYRIYLEFVGVLHMCIAEIRSNNEIKYLRQIYVVDQYAGLSQSTKTTYELLNRKYSIDEIAKIRKLKRSTIEDHIVEIFVYSKAIDIHQFVSSKVYEQIKEAINQLRTNKLKTIKAYVGEEISYFEIRLVLAKEG